jgi:hypothetical protein
MEDVQRRPPPQKTETYTPVPHKDLMDMVLSETDMKGFYLKKAEHQAIKDTNVLLSRYAFTGPDTGMDFCVATLNSYNKTKPVSIGIGTQVVICENGMIAADYRIKRKHTGDAWKDLHEMIKSSVNILGDEYYRNFKIKMELSEIEVSKKEYASIIGDMFLNEKIITPTQLGIVSEEFDKSELFPEPTAWSMYNHITQALKKSHPSNYIAQHVDVHNFMKNVFLT